MADLTSSLDSLSNALSSLLSTSNTGQTQVDMLVEAYKKTQSSKVDKLKEKKSALEKKSTFFTNLSTKIATLASQIDKFLLSNSNELFITRTVSSSDSSVVSATANQDALLGINSIKVNRLASNDILISNRMIRTNTFSISGQNLTFKINGKDVTVSIDAGSTNEQAIQKIVQAINSTSDINATASIVKDTSTTVRLTITAKNTGYDNRIIFDDNGSGVLNALGFNNVDPNATVRTPTMSGNEYAHYKIADSTQLDSEAEINGITVTNSSNTLSDVIQGLTINLLKAQTPDAQPVTLTTESDANAVKNLLTPLIDAFNDVVNFLNSNRNILREEPLLQNMATSLKTLITQPVTTVAQGNPKFLYEIGFNSSSNGTISLSDITKLKDALVSDPQKVSDLFTSSDGFVAKLNQTIATLKGETGYVTSKTQSVKSQINSVNEQINKIQQKIDLQAENYKKEYIRMLENYLKMQSQYNYLSSASISFSNSIYFSGGL